MKKTLLLTSTLVIMALIFVLKPFWNFNGLALTATPQAIHDLGARGGMTYIWLGKELRSPVWPAGTPLPEETFTPTVTTTPTPTITSTPSPSPTLTSTSSPTPT